MTKRRHRRINASSNTWKAWNQEMNRLMEYFSDISDDCLFWINLDPTNPNDRPKDDKTIWYYTLLTQYLCSETRLFPLMTPVGQVYSKKQPSQDLMKSLANIPVELLRATFRENQNQAFLGHMVLHMHGSFATQEDR